MKIYIFLPLFLCLLMTGEITAQPLRMFPVITPSGKGKVNTKIDNMGYWAHMVRQGYVLADPVRKVPAAKFTGSLLVPYQAPAGHVLRNPATHNPMTPQNSPDVAVTGETDVTQSENAVFIDPSDEGMVLNSNNSTNWMLGSADRKSTRLNSSH